MLDVDYEENENIFDYVDTMQIVRQLGGIIKAAPSFLNFFAPIMIL